MALGTKKQHFVPRLLLRRFANRSERLFAFDKTTARAFPTTVEDVGHQNHFLTYPALDGANGPGSYFESFFQTFEGPADRAIRGIEAAIDAGVLRAVSAEHRLALSEFIALQHLRTPAAREQTLQISEITRRVFAEQIAEVNGFDANSPGVAKAVETFSTISEADYAAQAAASILSSTFIKDFGKKLSGHVWILGINNTPAPLYLSDHPITVYGHVERPGRGLGPLSYGAEVVVPLSSRLQLSLYDRRFIRAEIPHFESLDAMVGYDLSPENIEFERSLQTMSAQRFLYCELADFDLAREVCDKDPELRDPSRARVEALAFGKHVLPKPRTPKK